MFCTAAVLPVIILVITQACGQHDLLTSDPDFNGGVFGHSWFGGWWDNLWKGFEHLFSFGGNGVIIDTNNGTTTVSAEIGGKRYNATFPGVTSVSTSTTIVDINGTRSEEFRIKAGNETFTYKTVNGTTTVTDGQGQNVPDGGPFHVRG